MKYVGMKAWLVVCSVAASYETTEISDWYALVAAMFSTIKVPCC